MGIWRQPFKNFLDSVLELESPENGTINSTEKNSSVGRHEVSTGVDVNKPRHQLTAAQPTKGVVYFRFTRSHLVAANATIFQH